MTSLFIRHAEICKTFANPMRLVIINALRDEKELSASALLKLVKTSKANLSQHMSVLVQKGVVTARRAGISVFYRLADNRITQACDIMRDVLISNLEAEAKALKQYRK
jgi:ArsR family transcriptional regulator